MSRRSAWSAPRATASAIMGVMAKVDAIHERLKRRIGTGAGELKLRLVQPEYTIATSDGIRNGTREMRYSLIGREITNDAMSEHLSATGLAGTIAVVACRQAAGRRACGAARTQSARHHHVGRADPSGSMIPRPARRSTSSAPIRSRAIPTRRSACTSPAMPARASAAAAACSPTTPCRPSSAWSACSRCTWWRRPPTIRAV